jgi:hypothetical protein
MSRASPLVCGKVATEGPQGPFFYFMETYEITHINPMLQTSSIIHLRSTSPGRAVRQEVP